MRPDWNLGCRLGASVIPGDERFEFHRKGRILFPEFELGDLVSVALADAQDADDPAVVPVGIVVVGDRRRSLGVGMDGADILKAALGDDAGDFLVIGDDIIIGGFFYGRDGDAENFERAVLQFPAQQDAVELPGVAAAGAPLEPVEVLAVDNESCHRTRSIPALSM